MAPAQVGITWAPGERLLKISDDSQQCVVDIMPTLPPPMLKMFFSAHARFMDRNIDMPQVSKEYLSLIDICMKDIEEMGAESPRQLDQKKSLVSELRQAYKVWSFIDAIYISELTDGHHHASYSLPIWFRRTYPDQCFYNDPSYETPDSDGAIWNEVIQRILLGDFIGTQHCLTLCIRNKQLEEEEWRTTTAAINLAQFSHIPTNVSPFILIEAILSGKPEHNLSTRADGSWTAWQKSCVHWTEHPALEKCPEACQVLQIISGDIDAIGDACSSWEQMFVSCSLYMHNDIVSGGHMQSDSAGLAEACGLAVTRFNLPTAEAGGGLIEAALGNLQEAVVRLHATMPSSWFAAHLCDVLVRAGLIRESDARPSTDDVTQGGKPFVSLREGYLKEFASSLERYRGCWRIAVDYLCACPTHGIAMLIDMLGRVPLDGATDRTAEKILRVCHKRGLKRTAVRVCERVGVRCLQADALGRAVVWFARADLIDRCKAIGKLAVTRAERGGPFSVGARQLEAVALSIQSCENDELRVSLLYMRRYYELQEARAKIKTAREAKDEEDLYVSTDEFAEAARSLITLGGADRMFWCVIAYEAAKVLELYPDLRSHFSRKLLLDLLSALELGCGPYRAEHLVDGLRRRLTQESMSLEQLAQEEATPCSFERLDKESNHCREVFLKCLAKRINQA